MRKYSFAGTLSAAAMMALLVVGCQKDQDMTKLTLSVAPFHGDSKVYLDENDLPRWNLGDKVFVNEALDPAPAISFEGTNATLEVPTTLAYKAIYPNEIVSQAYGNQFTLNLPRVQLYEKDANNHQLVKAPMGAFSTDNYLTFTNLGSLLAISVINDKGIDLTIDSVSVRASGTALWGPATVADITSATRKYTMVNAREQKVNDRVSLAGAEDDMGFHEGMNVALANGATSPEFFVYVPSVESGNIFSVVVYTHDANGAEHLFHRVQTRENSGCIPLSAIATVPFGLGGADEKVIQGAIKAFYSVSPTLQVLFSVGNLQWIDTGSHVVAGGATVDGTFRFAPHQYDAIMWHDGNLDNSTVQPSTTDHVSNQWIDLFTYGSSGYDAAYPPYYWTGTTTMPSGATSRGTMYDWGEYNAISNGGNQPGQWRTLTSSEWDYMVNSRTNASNLEIPHCAVGGVIGTMYFPDLWDWNDPQIRSICTGVSAGEEKQFTLEEWAVFERFGATFVPAYDSYYLKTKQGTSTWVVLDGPNLNDFDGPNGGSASFYWVLSSQTSPAAYHPIHEHFHTNIDSKMNPVRLARDATSLDFEF
ncbi:MAG: hypothetical protein MJZ86_00580 [Bacteroidales bacterium]|nr:hypothetical protein [Bacteroidales bacterium]